MLFYLSTLSEIFFILYVTIIIRHQLGIDRPVPATSNSLIVPSKIFQVDFFHLVCNSTLFLASWFCSFLLHVAANFLCIF